jgi:hypothetical protein
MDRITKKEYLQKIICSCKEIVIRLEYLERGFDGVNISLGETIKKSKKN